MHVRVGVSDVGGRCTHGWDVGMWTQDYESAHTAQCAQHAGVYVHP